MVIVQIFVAVCLCIATHIQAAGIADEPDRYNKLIETTIKSLEKRKKWVEDNLIKFKTPNSASNNQTVTALGSLSATDPYCRKTVAHATH